MANARTTMPAFVKFFRKCGGEEEEVQTLMTLSDQLEKDIKARTVNAVEFKAKLRDIPSLKSMSDAIVSSLFNDMWNNVENRLVRARSPRRSRSPGRKANGQPSGKPEGQRKRSQSPTGRRKRSKSPAGQRKRSQSRDRKPKGQANGKSSDKPKAEPAGNAREGRDSTPRPVTPPLPAVGDGGLQA